MRIPASGWLLPVCHTKVLEVAHSSLTDAPLQCGCLDESSQGEPDPPLRTLDVVRPSQKYILFDEFKLN